MTPRNPIDTVPPRTAVALCVLLAACNPPAPPPAPLPAAYVTPVKLATGIDERCFTATVTPRIESELAFRTGGKVAARLVELGQAVRAGQVLARLDAADYRLAVDAASEQLRAGEIDAQQAASDAARFQRLSVDGSVAGADQERQQARADAAAARVGQLQRQLELARNRHAYTELVTPFDGLVTAVRIEPGQVVGEGQPAIAVVRDGALELAVDIPERLAATLPTQQASALDPGAAPVPMTLRELAPSANPATRTYRARYTPARPGRTPWRLGMTVELRLAGPGADALAELPVGAVVKTDAQPFVWVVQDAAAGRLRQQTVELVAQDGDRVRLRGLSKGALVVTAGAHKLDAGMRVRAVARPLALPLAVDGSVGAAGS